MPVTAADIAKGNLSKSINAAFTAAKKSGSQDGASPDAVIAKLSSDLTDAINAYVTAITVQSNPGAVTATGDTIVTPQLS